MILTKFLKFQILEPESGWEPVPLTDMMSTRAVRKHYENAEYLTSAVRLVQRGASTREKYICKKVLEILNVCSVRFMFVLWALQLWFTPLCLCINYM